MDSLYYFLTFIKISNSIIAINSIQQLTSKLDLTYKQPQISNINIYTTNTASYQQVKSTPYWNVFHITRGGIRIYRFY